MLTQSGGRQGEDPILADTEQSLLTSLHLSGDSLRGSHQGRTQCKLLTRSGIHGLSSEQSLWANFHLSGDFLRVVVR